MHAGGARPVSVLAPALRKPPDPAHPSGLPMRAPDTSTRGKGMVNMAVDMEGIAETLRPREPLVRPERHLAWPRGWFRNFP